MKHVSLVVLLSCFICGCASVQTTSKNYAPIPDPPEVFDSVNIPSTVQLGDSIEDVARKIGNPKELLSKELTPDGKEKVTYLYLSWFIKRGKTLEDAANYTVRLASHPEGNGRIVGMDGALKTIDLFKQLHPPYEITFIDGKVYSIKRNM